MSPNLTRRTTRFAPAAAFITTLAALSGCFQPPVDPNGRCKLEKTCDCTTKADCAEGLDCIDGHCGVLVIDAGPGNGELGATCTANGDCKSNLCLPAGPGRSPVCTVGCEPTDGGAGVCPSLWECKTTTFSPEDGGGGALPSRLCVPPFNALCLSCTKDSDCNATGDLCVPLGGDGGSAGSFCGRDCSQDGCPNGYACQTIPNEKDGGAPRGKQCVPVAGTCECSDLTVGLGRACKSSGNGATCYGFELCQSNGTWAGCNAPAPSTEICNGKDDDCDGLVDKDDPSIDFSGLPKVPPYPSCVKGSSGACVGVWDCIAHDGGTGADWSCGAPDPRPELCNGLDEDCNGAVDEPFLNSAKQYQHINNCGSCGFDCERAIDNLADGGLDGGAAPGAVSCDLRNGSPTCVPKLCAQGYAPSPPTAPVMCQKVIGSSCRACTVDQDCNAFGDKCVTMGSDPGTWCAQACDSNAPYPGCTGQLGAQGCCPSGYTCEQKGANKLCIPDGDSCTCKPDRAGATRSCLVTIPQATCLGLETCSMTGDWSTCDTSTTTIELCDNADNNCDGKIDEPFINTRGSGTYDTDTHCGSCNTNCTAQWSPTIQHAIGGCDAGVTIPPTCQIVKCTQESISGGGACQVDGDCGVGRVCHPLYHQCVQSCSSAATCPTGACVNGFCTSACNTDGDCVAKFGAPSTCSNGTCSVSYQFVNADKEPTNGCECPSASGVVDVPDLYKTYPDAGVPYVDRDCDLVDGVAATSLFVRAGATAGNGTRNAPFGTITAAINAYVPGTHTAILVAAGSYVEQVVLKNGVQLYGGYSNDFSSRDVVAFPTLIEGPEPDFASGAFKRGTVNAEGITSPTVIAGFTIRGYDVTFRPAAGAPGVNSYAVYVKDSNAQLTIANDHIVGGRGGDAAAGSPGTAGTNGGTGTKGLDSKECTSTTCANETQAGGNGGINGACLSANGNSGAGEIGNNLSTGAAQGYQPPLGKNGLGASNGTYFHSAPSQNNLCKYDCQIAAQGMNGGAAQNGNDGNAGSGGPGCFAAAGGIAGDDWVGSGGASGTGGSAATGGGGGGAGGAVINNNPPGCTIGNRVGDLGGTGGGGGAGGCGGTSGTGGGAGGGSFGIFLLFSAPPASTPTIQGNIVDPGPAGRGGNGGPGGYGGAGGQGGEGGLTKNPAWCAGNGGHGGRGGNGGAGGGGGGGCGGVSWGIAGNYISNSAYAVANNITTSPSPVAGSAGAGGASPAGGNASGGVGAQGLAGPFVSF